METLPDTSPETMPADDTVATVLLLLAHVPPLSELV
jgi:hypothetical protein